MVAAAAIALIGVFSGLLIGRRQVRDQAQVEHGQWLRGQRQEAFVALIAAWDEALPKLEAQLLDEEEIMYLNRSSGWGEAEQSVSEAVERDHQPLRRAAERVQMLGPQTVDAAVTEMLNTATVLRFGVMAQYDPEPAQDHDPVSAFRGAWRHIDADRRAFLLEARKVLRQTPDTKRP
ncbi:hypothetical protein ACWD0G_00800 [Streptomyces goshikiensis]